QPIVVDVGHDDIARAHMPRDGRGHGAYGAGTRDEHIFSDQVEGERRMCGIAERIEYRDQFIRHVVGYLEGVECRQRQVIGECAGTVYADTRCVAAQVPSACPAIAAEAAGNVPFAGHPVPDPETGDLLADGHDLAHILMADVHGHRYRARRPIVPFPDMDVRPAYGGLPY